MRPPEPSNQPLPNAHAAIPPPAKTPTIRYARSAEEAAENRLLVPGAASLLPPGRRCAGMACCKRPNPGRLSTGCESLALPRDAERASLGVPTDRRALVRMDNVPAKL